MTTSAFAWLDHDDGDRRRMMEVVNLFREKGTLDELGIGTIRDTLADHFFPGTSTIQTRARYFLFIPWLYDMLERDRVPSSRVESHARSLQWHLVQSLKAGREETAGVIGTSAGESVQHLPSAIYWQGLRRWGIRLFEGSTERYHLSLDSFYRQERAARSSDGGELIDIARRNWHGSLPEPPENLLGTATFALTEHDAAFLSERIRRSAPDSLLAACLTSTLTRQRQARAPWELGRLDSLPDRLRADIEDARRYSLVMEGAVLLYNLMMAELSAEHAATPNQGGVDRYVAHLERWADEIVGDHVDLLAWDRIAFWNRLHQLNPRLQPSAVSFSDVWLSTAISAPLTVRDNVAARRLIRDREYRLKTTLARLNNPRALERWSGESGVGRQVYRWPNAQRIVVDIRDGLRLPTTTA